MYYVVCENWEQRIRPFFSLFLYTKFIVDSKKSTRTITVFSDSREWLNLLSRKPWIRTLVLQLPWIIFPITDSYDIFFQKFTLGVFFVCYPINLFKFCRLSIFQSLVSKKSCKKILEKVDPNECFYAPNTTTNKIYIFSFHACGSPT